MHLIRNFVYFRSTSCLVWVEMLNLNLSPSAIKNPENFITASDKFSKKSHESILAAHWKTIPWLLSGFNWLKWLSDRMKVKLT